MEDNSSSPSSMVKPLVDTPCCLAHVFSHVAALNPHKIAVIHATSRKADAALYQGGVVAKDGSSKRDGVDVDAEEFGSSAAGGRRTKTMLAKLNASGEGVRSPIGDVTYTFQEVQGAVESLAIRIGYEFSIAAGGSRLAAGGIGGEQVMAPYLSFVQNSTPKLSQENEGNGLKYDSTSYCTMQNEKMVRSPTEMWETSHITKRVGVWMVQSCEYLVSILAILKAGFVFIPLDPSWPLGRLQRVLQSAKLELLLGCKHSLWAPHSLDSTKLHEIELAAGCQVLWLPEDYIKSCSKEYDAFQIDDDRRCSKKHQRLWCYVLHTSGSSGTPKGVCGTEKGLLNRLQWMENAYPHVNADVGCFKTAIGFVDHLTEALGPLLAGVPLVIPSPDILKANLLSLIKFIEEFKITRLTAVPSLIRALLPALQSRCHQLRTSLRVLVLSGEPLPWDVWRQLQSILGDTTILNLYGSTELSGDSSCFNCTNLLEDSDTLSKFSQNCLLFTLPIGEPITGCFYFIVVDESKLAGIEEEGELWVGGLGVAHSYLDDPGGTREKFINLSDDNEDDGSLVYRQLKKLMLSNVEKLGSTTKFRKHETSDERSIRVFKTGDIVKRLANGNLVLLGRKDRQIKIRGNRIALEEIEINTEQHLKVKSVAVIPRERLGDGEITMVAYVVPEGQHSNFILQQEESHAIAVMGVKNIAFETELKIWLAERMPPVMVPETFVFLANLPMTKSGKTDYKTLATTFRIQDMVASSAQRPVEQDLPGVEYIRKVFAQVLRTENLLPTEDFFSAGGTSISAAHASHILGIDMRVLYTHPSAIELHGAIGDKNGIFRDMATTDEIDQVNRNFENHTQEHVNAHNVSSSLDLQSGTDVLVHKSKSLKRKHLDFDIAVDEIRPSKEWTSRLSNFADVAFMRCNRMVSLMVSSRERISPSDRSTVPWEIQTLNNKKWCIQQCWRVSLRSCVDASPLLVCHKNVYRLFIGSHSHNLLSVDATSGEVIWEAQLSGRIESSATITQDSSQVVVGCYDGLIYFIDYWDGQVVWSFETGGEVKCQPTSDPWTGLIWCGSHDHHIYALDTSARKCVWQHDCCGSIFGAPAFDEVALIQIQTLSPCMHRDWKGNIDIVSKDQFPTESPIEFKGKNIVFIATTNGTLIAVKSKPTIHVIWTYKVGTPIFGSLAVDPSTEMIICTSVNGSIYALNAYGRLVWEVKTDGPIFAGATISSALTTQVLVCSGDSQVYCLNLEDGVIEWKHNVGYPITSSAYVDENLVLSSGNGADKIGTKRLVCVASTSGTLCVFQAPSKRSHIDISSYKSHPLVIEKSELIPPEKTSQAVAHMTLPGEVFSSPVMVSGRIFVGCRNNYLYCLDLLI